MRFSKWHALGNSYLLIERAEAGGPLTPALVARLCDVGTGVGSDGVLEVVAAEASKAEVIVWNPDGSTAEFSGNGARIAAAWLAQRAEGGEVRLRVGTRIVNARRRGPAVELEIGHVEVGPPERLHVAGEEVELTPVSIGNPHAVVRLDFTAGDIERYGRALERHPRFPERTNVQLVRPLAPRTIEIAIWERGAGVTRSSGSSAVAAAAAAVANGWCAAPVTVVVPGAGELLVELDAASDARLTGPVEEIGRGETVFG